MSYQQYSDNENEEERVKVADGKWRRIRNLFAKINVEPAVFFMTFLLTVSIRWTHLWRNEYFHANF
jgi:hypothetical protein